MEYAWVDQISNLVLGMPPSVQKKLQDSKHNQTPLFVRLICPPLPFLAGEVTALCERIRNNANECEWETIPNIIQDDSFLGQIELGTLSGLEIPNQVAVPIGKQRRAITAPTSYSAIPA